MEKLYYQDQYIRDFICEIEEIKEVDGKFHVALDRTAFFPGGGGQRCDVGYIENEPVIDVYEEGDVVYHVVQKKPIKIHRVKASIDWENRFDGMQQHLAQHVLSGCFFSLFHANTVGIHLGKEVSTVDIEGVLSEEIIREVEREANKVIQKNLRVEILTPTKSELKKMQLRRALPNTKEEIRVVQIEELDINACCGIHPNSTLQLQAIKIKRWQKHKNATRIEFLAGKRAVEDYFIKDNFTKEICRYLNCNYEEAINAIKNLADENKQLLNENRKIKEEIRDYQVKEMVESSEKIGEIAIVKNIYEGGDTKHISKVATKIVEGSKAIVLFANRSGDRVNLIFMCSKELKGISMDVLLKDAITLVDGRGGGSACVAQGGGKNNNNLDSLIDYAVMKVKNTLKHSP